MKKFTAIIEFEVDDDVEIDDVFRMTESDLTSGEFFVKNEEYGSDHIKNIKLKTIEVKEEN